RAADELSAGRDRYVATKPDWQSWCSAERFLKEERWLQAGRDQTEMLMPISGGHSTGRPGNIITAAHAALAAGPLRGSSFVAGIRAAAAAGPLRCGDEPTAVGLRRDEAQDLREAGARLMQRIGQAQFQAWFSDAVLVGVREDT